MRIDLNAKVVTHDGHDAGEVSRAVVDPSTNKITGFVVNTGNLFGRDVIVPPQEFAGVMEDGKSLRLGIDKDELEQRPSFISEDYTTPPATWIPPEEYVYPTTGYMWPAGGHVIPAGGEAPTASPEANAELEDAGRVIAVSKGAAVLDADGREIGVVDDVQLDPESGRLTGLVFRMGGSLQTLFGLGQTRSLPASALEGLERDGSVRLRLRKDELKRAA